MLCKSYIDTVYTFCVKCKHIFIYCISFCSRVTELQHYILTFPGFSMADFPRLARFEVSRGAAASAPWQTLEGNRPTCWIHVGQWDLDWSWDTCCWWSQRTYKWCPGLQLNFKTSSIRRQWLQRGQGGKLLDIIWWMVRILNVYRHVKRCKKMLLVSSCCW